MRTARGVAREAGAILGGTDVVPAGPLSILVVVAERDERRSTVTLRALAETLASRSDVEVEVWFLRPGEGPRWDLPERDVDGLRTWGPNQQLERIWAGLAGRVRGLRLRGWWRTARPDVVVLDDGLGRRLLPSGRTGPAVVVRRNPEPPATAALEDPPSWQGDLELAASSGPAGGRALRLPDLVVDVDEVVARSRTASARVRTAIGVGPEVPLVVGWGGDGWLDGPDLFVRTLWYLEDRHGIAAHGVWLGLADLPGEAARLVDEARRCGLADRYHLRALDEPADRLAGDVVLLPYRTGAHQLDVAQEQALVEAVGSGSAVVTFEPMDLDVPDTTCVAPLDLEAAAEHVAGALDRDRAAAVDAARRLVGRSTWAEHLASALREVAAR